MNVIVFSSPYCRACNVVKDFLTKEKKVSFSEVNVELHPDLVQKWDIRTLPTIILVDNGKEVARTIGSRPQSITNLVGMMT
jgi:thioredoxin-like negative regulator of GroEL